MDRPSFLGAYSTRDVAKLLGLSESRIRSYARAGFVQAGTGPRGELHFTFQDLILLRTAKALLEARIPRRRIHIALRNLQGQLPQGRALTGVRISAHGQQVVARDGGEAWNPESGQTLLDFEVSELAREATRLARHPALAATGAGDEEGAGGPSGPPGEAGTAPLSLGQFSDLLELASQSAEPLRLLRADVLQGRARSAPLAPATPSEPATPSVATGRQTGEAESSYELAMRLEDEGRPEEALAAYRRAVELDPGLADARLDFGRLLHQRGEVELAEERYRQALALRPGDATAAYNLGVALADRGRLEEAAQAYETALAADPALSDAHYNLAGVYEALGRSTEAFRHLRTYRVLTQAGES